MDTKKKNKAQNELGGLIGLAIGVGVSTSVALNDPALGFAIPLFICGLIALGKSLRNRTQA